MESINDSHTGGNNSTISSTSSRMINYRAPVLNFRHYKLSFQSLENTQMIASNYNMPM